jgi:hypothetical protein
LETKGTLSAKTPNDSQFEPEDSPPVTFTPTIAPETSESFPSESNLDPALLDPEMSAYFFGSQDEPDPPAYTEIEHPHEFLQSTAIERPSWLPPLTNPFETYIAQPLATALDPSLLVPQPLTITALNQTSITQERSISISPAMLDKSSAPPVQEEVVWYSSGKEMQVGGKFPPVTKHGGKGKSFTNGGKGFSAPAKGTGKGKSILGKRPVKALSTSEVVSERTGKEYETIVVTGLESVKRIKLIYREDSPRISDDSRPTSSGSLSSNKAAPGSRMKPFKVDWESPKESASDSQKRDTKKLEVPRVTPPAAMGVEGRRIPMASELHLDDNTPPPTIAVLTNRSLNVEVVVHKKRFDRSQYPMFLAKDAEQTVIRDTVTGEEKGLTYSW